MKSAGAELDVRPCLCRTQASEFQRARTQYLQRAAAGRWRKLVEQVVGPAMVVLNTIAAAAIPVKGRGAERVPATVCIRHIHGAGDLTVAAAAVGDVG